MTTPLKNLNSRNKAVVAFLDGRRLKGYIYNFSALKERFRLFSEEDLLQREGTDVEMKELKAIFFARDFIGNPGYQESQTVEASKQGRKVEVIFKDGEKLVGTTDAYNPQKLGLFVFPADPRSNNLRVFVISKNVQQIRWV